jgi:hypothetical protein
MKKHPILGGMKAKAGKISSIIYGYSFNLGVISIS